MLETYPMPDTTSPAAESTLETQQVSIDDEFEIDAFNVNVDEVDMEATHFDGSRIAAPGRFVVVTVRLENISSEPADANREWFRLEDAEGAVYDRDSDMAIRTRREVNPGNEVRVSNPYSVPEDTEITHLLVEVEEAQVHVEL
ncbi:DUF4352 domain-containing protein [Nocardiopsis alba]|uniref:DUF4352 domain-containing protein n=1 Tax=Nocardiopsis alba TaxID=53437 RepID=UPI0033A84EFC